MLPLFIGDHMSLQKHDLLPDHKIFIRADGRRIGAHKHSCLFCDHCTDIYWDYTHSIYGIDCELVPCRNGDNIRASFEGKCPDFKEDEQ